MWAQASIVTNLSLHEDVTTETHETGQFQWMCHHYATEQLLVYNHRLATNRNFLQSDRNSSSPQPTGRCQTPDWPRTGKVIEWLIQQCNRKFCFNKNYFIHALLLIKQNDNLLSSGRYSNNAEPSRYSSSHTKHSQATRSINDGFTRHKSATQRILHTRSQVLLWTVTTTQDSEGRGDETSRKSQMMIESSCELLTIWKSSNWSRNTRPVCSCITAVNTPRINGF